MFFEEIWDQRFVNCKLVGSTFNNDPLAISFNLYIRFSYTVLFALMKTVKLLLFLGIYPEFSGSNRGRNWNFSMKPVYLLLVIYEGTMVMLDLHITYILVVKSIILVPCQWYQLKERRLRKLTGESY